FVAEVIKPLALKPERMEARARPLLVEALDQASQMGLRTLALSEEQGGAGADNLTCCIVTEELAVGDPDVAAVLAQTATLAQALFDRVMTAEQRAHFLPAFLADPRYHLALAEHEADRDAALGINYHRPQVSHTPFKTAAARAGDGWTLNGSKDCVVGASLAALFVVRASIGENGVGTLLVPRDTPGLSVIETEAAARAPWCLRRIGVRRLPRAGRECSRRGQSARCRGGAPNPAGSGAQSRNRPRRLRGGARLRATAHPGRASHHRPPGDRRQARRD